MDRAQSLLLLTFPPTSRRKGPGAHPRARVAKAPLFFHHTHTVPCAPQRLVAQICRAEVSRRQHIPNPHQTEQLQDKKVICMGLQEDTGERLTVPPMTV